MCIPSNAVLIVYIPPRAVLMYIRLSVDAVQCTTCLGDAEGNLLLRVGNKLPVVGNQLLVVAVGNQLLVGNINSIHILINSEYCKCMMKERA